MNLVNHANFNKNEAQNMRIQNLAGAPTSPVVGQLYVETTGSVNRLYQWNGTAWVLKATDSDNLGGQLPAYYLNRANHSGTQLAATISDLASTVQGYRLDQFAIPTADLNINSRKLTNVATPVAGTDAANKQYVDDAVNGFDWKASVRVASTANIATLSGLLTIDGVTLVAGNRVLVKDQTTGSANGIYVAAAGAWARSTDADLSSEVTPGMAMFVEEGTANGNQQWVLTTDGPITLGTTSLVFAQVGAQGTAPAAGNGLTFSSNTYAVGAGTGITVGATTVGINTAVVAGKATGLIGNGAATSIAFVHSLANQWVNAQIFDATSNQLVEADIVLTDANTITVTFAVAPTTNQYRVVVTG